MQTSNGTIIKTDCRRFVSEEECGLVQRAFGRQLFVIVLFVTLCSKDMWNCFHLWRLGVGCLPTAATKTFRLSHLKQDYIGHIKHVAHYLTKEKFNLKR